MKKAVKLTAAFVLALLLTAAICFPGSASTVSDWSRVKLEEFIKIMNGYVDTSDFILDEGKTSMRGFTLSPDGRYAFGGFLNPTGTAAVCMFDLTTALPAGYYVHEQADGARSYPKGLAADDRGYLYVGLAYYPNNGTADFAVVKYDDKGEMTRVSYTNIMTSGTPGDKTSPKMGVNGAAVEKIGERYYAYFVVNYDLDYLCRFDVTDPQNPKPDNSFGTEGRVNLASKFGITDGQYLDVDSDGTIYLCASASAPGLFVISADGGTQLDKIDIKNAYSACLTDDYVFVTTSSGPPAVNVLDRVTLKEIATVTAHTGANMYVYVTVADGILYVANQASSSADFESILVAPLDEAGGALVASRRASIAAALEAANAATTTKKPVEATQAPTVDTTTAAQPENTSVPGPVDSGTEAPIGQDKATELPETEPVNTGCGSSLAFGFVLTAVIIPAVAARKKKD